MGFMNEYGLLIAIATPVAAVALINALLALGGETGTLLLPSLRPYPTLMVEAPAMEAAPVEAPVPARRAAPTVTASADDAEELLAHQAA